jgi:hypothetical protein
MPWTHFWDMYSGGGKKEPWSHIYIEAPEEEAKVIFYNRFGHSPERVSCTCCGGDYSITEYKTLAQATEYHRKGIPLKEYLALKEAKIIRSKTILPSERIGQVPQQGYVWMD